MHVSPVIPQVVVDRTSPVPLYFQLAQQLEQQIRQGDLPSGARLENEITLSDQLGVSRPTMRNAIRYLVDRGLVSRQRGIGTLVLPPQVRRPAKLTSLFDDLEKTGQRPWTKVLSFRLEPASVAVAEILELEPGDEVYAFQRLRYAGDEPLALLHNHMPARLVQLTQEALQQGGLYAALREANLSPKVAQQVIGARTATAAEARLLDETRGAPLLTMERTARDAHGRAIEYGSHVYRARRYSFELTLSAT